jgi:hypothetical protein
LNIAVYLTTRNETINGVSVPANAMLIMPPTHGEFGFAIEFRFSALQLLGQGFNNNNSLDLYHIDEQGRATKVSDSYLTRSGGGITVRIDHASFYVLSAEPLIADDSGDKPATPQAPNRPSTPSGGVPNPETGIVPSATPLVIMGGLVVVTTKMKRRKK